MDELVKELKKNGYLHTGYNATKSGYALYDDEVEQAVKYCQEDNNRAVTGVYTSSDKAYGIKPSKHHHLGTRDLKVGEEGSDIAELIMLLKKAGFAPDSLKVKEGQMEYSEAISDAVRIFQAFAGINPTGIADRETINKLKTYK